jgi:glutathione-regulated potassium-efflux system ancillary protein KefC
MEHLGVAVAIFAAAVVAVPVAVRLGLGAVLGYLVAGIAIGPWVGRIVTDVPTILSFSELGVVLMMFVIGLELEPKRLWALRRSIFANGAIQLAVCAAAFAAIGLAWAPWPVALVAGLGLALSSTAIAMATLEERNLTATPAGTAGFGILLFQDIAAIPIIALVPLLATGGVALGEGQEPGWFVAGRALLVLAAVVLVGRVVMRQVFRLIALTELREIFTAAALLIVVGIAALMESLHLSMSLGAFIAGVLLADSEYRHELEADIDPFKGLLLGLFFIAVGMSIDFGVLLDQPATVLLLTAGFVALKWGLMRALTPAFGVVAGQRGLFATLLGQGGEFAFVVFSAGLAARVLDAATASLLTLVVALSMLSTPLVLLLQGRLARRRGVEDRPEADVIEGQDNPVILAGFGRVGQIVGRLLTASGVSATVLEHDPNQVEFLRQFGFKVFYGDATRLDLLEQAGIARARVLVIALDDPDTGLALASTVRERYPALKIVTRVRDLTQLYRMKDLGVTAIERETFEGALMIGRHVLEALGESPHVARNAARKFRRFNLAGIERVYPHYKDRKALVSITRESRRQMEEMFAEDRAAREREREEGGWD